MSIWNSNDAEKATNGTSSQEWSGGKLTIDSRNIEKDDIFVALSGENTDGHNYVSEALKRGASCAIISKDINENIATLKVSDTLTAIDDLAIYRRNQTQAKMIAVTGSVGKTTTKEMLKLAFSALGKTHSSQGNYNNRLGMPISLASMDHDCDYGIFEIGMNHSGEISPLSDFLKPDLAIITIIAPVHIEFFDSVEDIALAKAEIFSGMKPGSTAILNIDNKYHYILEELAKKKGLRVINCGEEGDSKLIEINGDTITANIMGEIIVYKMQQVPEHLIKNSIYVLSAVKALGGDLKKAAANLINFFSLKGRGKKSEIYLDGKKVILIDDSYNASPPSVKAALASLGKYKNRKIAILGNMLELGENSVKFHVDLKEDIESNNIDKVITFGNLMHELHKCLPDNKKLSHIETLDELITYVNNISVDGDVILVKGSHGSRLYQFVEHIS